MIKPSIGDIIEVRFLDHGEDPSDDDPLDFMVWGRVSSITKTHYEITCWGYADGERRLDDNEKRYQILKRVITDLKILS